MVDAIDIGGGYSCYPHSDPPELARFMEEGRVADGTSSTPAS